MEFWRGTPEDETIESVQTQTLPRAHVDMWDLYDIGRVDNYFTGAIDQVSFFNYALSDDDVQSLHADMDPSGWDPPFQTVSEECKMSTDSANQCGQAGQLVTCVPADRGVRLSSYPQGRIEMYSEVAQQWGTVCGHWLWDNDEPANIVCRQLGYAGGTLYTYGSSSTALH
eukprot:SAG11_NODE_17813_length_508_cov_0.909535_1_plen_169_part_11